MFVESSARTMKQSNERTQLETGKKKGEPSAATPIFLRKTYDMINTCDTSTASWFDNGKTFVIKDIERFSTEIIPDYFKHNNFSSFVRQLNFYGFRKIKCGSLRIDDATSDESKYWKFRHEKFQQGRPDLLSQIRKSSGETVDKQEVEQLKNEVRDLKDTLSGVSDHVAQLKSLVECFILKQNLPEHKQTMNLPEVTSNKRKGLDGQEHIMSVPSSDSLVQAALTMLPSSNSSWLNMSNHQLLFDASNKKQKVADEERGMAIRSEPSFTPLPFTSSFSFQRRHLDSERNVTHVERNAVWSNLPRMPPPAPMTRYGSIGAASQTSLDEGILASLLALGDDDTPFADNSGSRNATFR